MHSVDRAVALLAASQCGVFSRCQVVRAGAYKSLIRRRVTSGLWDVVAGEDVFGLPGYPPSFRRSLWTILLGLGDGAVVSHWSAAHLHGLEGFAPNRFTVTVPHGSYRQVPFGVVYQTIVPAEPSFVDGLPVTPVDRTLVDLGRLVGPVRLGMALDEAASRRKCSIRDVRRLFFAMARQGRPGITSLRAALAEREGSYVPPTTLLERSLYEIADSIPGVVFSRQAVFPGRERLTNRVDAISHDPRLILEGDGRDFHTRLAAARRDRERDRSALRLGYPTARYMWEELTTERDITRQELVELVAELRFRESGVRNPVP